MRAIAFLVLAACGSSPPAASDAPAPDADKAAGCASAFGTELTNAFGRLDGTVLAIVPPGNQTCAMPNATHVVLEVTMHGAAYRMVVNVLSTSSDPHVWLGAIDAPLAGPTWSEGWHPGVQLDYVATLGVAKTSFSEAVEPLAVDRVGEIAIGAHISVFATSSGGATADSAHLVHRNATNADGAIVLDPETAPHYLLTAFPEQLF
jgi:hypothetical protein